MNSILIGVITHAGEKYCRELFCTYLKNLITEDTPCLIVTNSGEEDKKDIEQYFTGLPVTVRTAPESPGDVIDQIVLNRNIVREQFLTGTCDYLYFLDSDMVGPRNAISVLRSHNKAFVSGWTLATFTNLPGTDGKPRILPVAYDFDTPTSVRQMTITDVRKPKLMPVASIGLGCALIHRALLNVPFTRTHATEDTVFCEHVKKQGEQLWLDTRVAYWHIKFPPGDKRNAYLDPRRYL